MTAASGAFQIGQTRYSGQCTIVISRKEKSTDNI